LHLPPKISYSENKPYFRHFFCGSRCPPKIREKPPKIAIFGGGGLIFGGF
jgi:hypothetical protein